MNVQKTAQKNQDYYLSEQESDSCGGLRWFRYIKTMGSYSEPVLITPQMAQEVLESDDFSLRKPLVDDGLSPPHPTITISFSGKLLAGYNVLQEIVESEQSAIVFVTFNISDKFKH